MVINGNEATCVRPGHLPAASPRRVQLSAVINGGWAAPEPDRRGAPQAGPGKAGTDVGCPRPRARRDGWAVLPCHAMPCQSVPWCGVPCHAGSTALLWLPPRCRTPPARVPDPGASQYRRSCPRGLQTPKRHRGAACAVPWGVLPGQTGELPPPASSQPLLLSPSLAGS